MKYFETKLYENRIIYIFQYLNYLHIKPSDFGTMQKLKNIATKHGKQFGERWAHWVIGNRWWVLALSLVVVAAMGTGLPKLGFDGDYRVFFSKENPQLQAFDELQNKYTQDDNVLIVIEPKDGGSTFTRETLSAIEDLTTLSWQTPYSSRVDAITNFQHTYAEGDELYVDDLVRDASIKTSQELTQVQKIALKEPLLVNRLLNEKGSVSAINITVKLPGEAVTEGPEVVAFVRDLTGKFEQENPNLKTHVSGLIMLNAAFFEASQKDSSTLIPLMFLAIVLTVLIATRTFTGTLSTLVVIIFSIVAGLGFAGLMGIRLTPPSGAAPIIIMTLAIADSIHILITMVQELRAGQGKNQAIIESLRVNFMPVFITSFTTIIGFLSMNTSDVPPFHDLGNITSVGMAGAFLFSVTTLPALMAILPVRIKARPASSTPENGFLDKLSGFVISHPKKLMWASALVIIALTITSTNNRLNDAFIKYFDNSISFRTDTDFISQNLTGIYNIEFSVGAGESGGINNPEYLRHLEKFEHWLEQQEEVVHVNAFTEVARRVNRSMHGDTASYYRVPSSREAAAQYLLLYEMSLPFGLDLNNQINVDKSETRLTATMKNLDSEDMIAFGYKAEQWLISNTPEYMHATAISPTLMFSHLSQRQLTSMISGTIMALIIISVVLMIALRSFGMGMLSLIPNIAPIAAGFGIWALFSGTINVGMAIVFGMTLGIIVDDTVHFLSKYLRARRTRNASAEEAVRYAFSTVGKALIVTTLVLLMGFVILAQSSFGMNSDMARITTIIISAALIIDFVLLPSLLILLARKKAPQEIQTLELAPERIK